MNLSFQPMSSAYAAKMLMWVYEPPYNIYGYGGEDPEAVIEYLTDKKNQFFAVHNGEEFIGFRSFGEDGQVEGGSYDDQYLDTGGGLCPEMTGKGLGEEVLRQGLAFGSEHFKTTCFRITVAAFNKRALKVVRRVGFREVQSFLRPGDNREFRVLTVALVGVVY